MGGGRGRERWGRSQHTLSQGCTLNHQQLFLLTVAVYEIRSPAMELSRESLGLDRSHFFKIQLTIVSTEFSLMELAS